MQERVIWLRRLGRFQSSASALVNIDERAADLVTQSSFFCIGKAKALRG
jgi:hypothetical protein